MQPLALSIHHPYLLISAVRSGVASWRQSAECIAVAELEDLLAQACIITVVLKARQKWLPSTGESLVSIGWQAVQRWRMCLRKTRKTKRMKEGSKLTQNQGDQRVRRTLRRKKAWGLVSMSPIRTAREMAPEWIGLLRLTNALIEAWEKMPDPAKP